MILGRNEEVRWPKLFVFPLFRLLFGNIILQFYWLNLSGIIIFQISKNNEIVFCFENTHTVPTLSKHPHNSYFFKTPTQFLLFQNTHTVPTLSKHLHNSYWTLPSFLQYPLIVPPHIICNISTHFPYSPFFRSINFIIIKRLGVISNSVLIPIILHLARNIRNKTRVLQISIIQAKIHNNSRSIDQFNISINILLRLP